MYPAVRYNEFSVSFLRITQQQLGVHDGKVEGAPAGRRLGGAPRNNTTVWREIIKDSKLVRIVQIDCRVSTTGRRTKQAAGSKSKYNRSVAPGVQCVRV